MTAGAAVNRRAAGATTHGAITELSPRRLIAAVPVAPEDNAARARGRVDEFIVLATPEPFIAVGHHYHCFAQVTDDEVLQYLNAAKHGGPAQVSHQAASRRGEG